MPRLSTPLSPGLEGQHWIDAARDSDDDIRRETCDCGGGRAESDCRCDLPGRDPLTGLPDRRLFERRVHRALERKRRTPGCDFAVCFIDLDGFKAVNDTFGHLAGDRVLCEVAQRLCECVRPGDLVARFGGDEFTVLLDNVRDESDAAIIAQRICRRLERLSNLERSGVCVAASIGIALSTSGSLCSDALLDAADRAMYRIKGQGGAAFAFSGEGFAAQRP